MKNTFLVLFGLMMLLQIPLQAQPSSVIESKKAHQEWKAQKKREKEDKKRARKGWKESRKSGKTYKVNSDYRSEKKTPVVVSEKARPKNSEPKKISREKKRTPSPSSFGKSSSRESKLIKEAYEYLGVKYKWGGESPRTGFDCSGFTQFVFESYGVKLPRNSAEQAKVGAYISVRKLEKGDLVFFADKGNKISHVGIVISKKNEALKMIHASSSEGITVTEIGKSTYWSSKIQYGRRISQ